jgi:hypothetical protein
MTVTSPLFIIGLLLENLLTAHRQEFGPIRTLNYIKNSNQLLLTDIRIFVTKYAVIFSNTDRTKKNQEKDRNNEI